MVEVAIGSAFDGIVFIDGIVGIDASDFVDGSLAWGVCVSRTVTGIEGIKVFRAACSLIST